MYDAADWLRLCCPVFPVLSIHFGPFPKDIISEWFLAGFNDCWVNLASVFETFGFCISYSIEEL